MTDRYACRPGVVMYWLLATVGALVVAMAMVAVWMCYRQEGWLITGVIAGFGFGFVRAFVRDLSTFRRALFGCRLPGCSADRARDEPFCARHVAVDKLLDAE